MRVRLKLGYKDGSYWRRRGEGRYAWGKEEGEGAGRGGVVGRGDEAEWDAGEAEVSLQTLMDGPAERETETDLPL